ncbi:MAG TPA: radical SAM protein [Chloroflexota bacterium]
MHVKMILPALLEAHDPGWRPIKYALFPPLGLATLAAYLDPSDHVTLRDEHVQSLDLDDEADLVVMSVYITSAYRAYRLADAYRARGAFVALGGLHVTSMPDEAAQHADTIFIGPGEEAWPRFLEDLRRGQPRPRYVARQRNLQGAPPIRRDLIDRRRYLCPNSIVVSRGCPHHCDFCYKDAFYKGGKSFYVQAVDEALAEIERLPGRHVYFLDDHLLGHPRFAAELFEGMRGMGRVFQGASTVNAVLQGDLIEKAAQAGMRSVFIGFETLSSDNLRRHAKLQNLAHDYDAAIRRVHSSGVMVNGSFVFGLDADGPDVFDRTVEWAISRGLETATFHIMTPYPGTALHQRLEAEGRIIDRNWDHYNTRRVVYRPERLSASQLQAGYDRAYRDFYRWRNIARGARRQATFHQAARHLAYAGGWKKLESFWDAVIRAGHVSTLLPLLEATLAAFGGVPADTHPPAPRPSGPAPGRRRIPGPSRPWAAARCRLDGAPAGRSSRG